MKKNTPLMRFKPVLAFLMLAWVSVRAQHVSVGHSYRVVSNTLTEHFFYVQKVSGGGKVTAIQLLSPFNNGRNLNFEPGEDAPILIPPPGWTCSVRNETGEEDRMVLDFETLPGYPGIAGGEAVLLKVITAKEDFKNGLRFKTYGTRISANYMGKTIHPKSFPAVDAAAFLQAFNYTKGEYFAAITGKPGAWGFTGAKWMIPKRDDLFVGSTRVSSEITTAGMTFGDFSLKTDNFLRPLHYQQGAKGFMVIFQIQFKDPWDANADGVEQPEETSAFTQNNTFTLYLEDIVHNTRPWGITLSPNTPSTSTTRKNLEIFSDKGQRQSVTLGVPAVTPNGEGESGGFLKVMLWFKHTGQIEVYTGSEGASPERALSFFTNTPQTAFDFNRLNMAYATGSTPETRFDIALDDFIAAELLPDAFIKGVYQGTGQSDPVIRVEGGKQYTMVLTTPINGAQVEVYVGNVRAEVIAQNYDQIVFRMPPLVGSFAVTVKLNGQTIMVPYKVSTKATMPPILDLLLR
jgi:hypothetical protein